MKKKLRDLTEKEYLKWKEKNCNPTSNTCEECIFSKVGCVKIFNSFWLANKDLYSDKFLNQEIEVEE